MSSAAKSRTGPRVAQFPTLAVGESAPRGGAAQVANHLGNKRRQRGVVGEMACIVDATAPPGVSLAHEPLTMRVNPVTRTPTPRYAPGRRPRAYHQTHARSVGPTRIPSDPRTKCRTQAHTIGPTCAARNASSSRALGAVSHAIRLSELSTVSANVAIPTIWLRGATQCRGNCMRHSWDNSPGGSHALPLIAPPVAAPLARR